MKRISSVWLAVVITSPLWFAFACATAPSSLKATTDRSTEDVFRGFRILGISGRTTATLNRTTREVFSEFVTLNVPVGTQEIIPVLNGWHLSYGDAVPEDWAVNNVGGTWNSDDQHFGTGKVSLTVVVIDDPNFDVTPATQTATISVKMLLVDEGGNDDWFGTVDYNLIYLGCGFEATPCPLPPRPALSPAGGDL